MSSYIIKNLKYNKGKRGIFNKFKKHKKKY